MDTGCIGTRDETRDCVCYGADFIAGDRIKQSKIVSQNNDLSSLYVDCRDRGEHQESGMAGYLNRSVPIIVIVTMLSFI